MRNDRTQAEGTRIEVPVLIVGAGPAGLAASVLLSRYGVEHMLVEKYEGTAHTPRAHIVNQRTVEVFRDMGLEDELLAVATPAELMSNNVWATSLAGRELARLRTWGTGPDRSSGYEKASPSPMCNCPQHILEPVLAEAAREAGVGDLRFYHEFLSLEQDSEGVTARVLDRASGEEITVRSRYLIGADGARSRVVEQVGLPLEGETGLGAAANVWFTADLTELCAYRPGVLYWNASPGKDYWIGAGTFICVRPWHEWVMLFMYDPEEGPPDTGDEAVTARVRKVIGEDYDVDVKIHSVSFWQINHVVASRYSEGRVFCMGDAVHRHPPANGLGLNTSIQDAFNLAWKLKLVLDGEADPSLLETYSAERQPVGKQTVDRAMKSVEDMAPIPEALGFRPNQSEEEGWASLDGLYEDSPEGRRRRAAFAKAVELQNYQFNAHGVEIGYRYRAGARVSDDAPEPTLDRDPELYYQPTTWPGARLPHAWLDKGRERLSTLDVVGHGKFVLLSGIGGEAWKEAAAEASEKAGVEVEVRFIGGGKDLGDSYGDWEKLREVQDGGCVLVRPDAHVAWRSKTASEESLKKLPGVMAEILGRSEGRSMPEEAIRDGRILSSPN